MMTNSPAIGSVDDAPDSKLEQRLLGLALIVVTALVFHRVVGFEFLTWDDDQHIVDNEYYQPVTLWNLLHFWGYSYIYMYIPVSYNFFGFEAWLSQFFPDGNEADRFNPAIFHLGNLLIHLGSVWLTYRLLWRMVRHAPGAFIGAMLFAVHPLQVESVAWIGETRGTLAAFFSLLAVHRYCNFAGVDSLRGIFAEQRYAPPQRRKRDYVWATVYFALALLSKPSAASLPLIVAVVDVVLLRRRWQDTLRWTALWFVMAAGITGLTKSYQKTTMIYARSVRDWEDRPLVAGDAYAFYLCKLAWPADLAFDHGRTPFYATESPTYDYAWLLPVGVGAVLACGRRRRIWLGCYAIFLVAVAPVSGIVPFLYQSISTVADRYMYVPLVGFGLMAAAFIATRRNPTWFVVVSAFVLGLAAHRSYEQTELWRDDWSVFRQGLKVTPRSFMAHLHLGNRLRKEKRYEAAIDHYQRMLKIRSDYFTSHYQIGVCLYELGRPDEAVVELERAVGIDRNYFDGWCMLGKARVEQENYDEAFICYRRVAEANPKSAEPQLLIGEAHARQKEYVAAEAAFRMALEIDKKSSDAHVRYGRMLVEAERLSDAARQFDEALQLDPQHHAARYESAATLFRQGKFVPALDAAEQAVVLKPDDFGSLQMLGMARAATGRAAAAIEPLEKALTLVPPGSQAAGAVRKTLNELKR